MQCYRVFKRKDDLSCGSIYDPESFPALIIKGVRRCNFLMFASWKIVIAGTESVKEINTSLFELLQRLDGFTNHLDSDFT